MPPRFRELEIFMPTWFEDTWMRAFDFWKNLARTNPPQMQNLGDGTREMVVSQMMTFMSYGQNYRLVFVPVENGTVIHAWVNMVYGKQWFKPLSILQQFADWLGCQQRVFWLT